MDISGFLFQYGVIKCKNSEESRVNITASNVTLPVESGREERATPEMQASSTNSFVIVSFREPQH